MDKIIAIERQHFQVQKLCCQTHSQTPKICYFIVFCDSIRRFFWPWNEICEDFAHGNKLITLFGNFWLWSSSFPKFYQHDQLKRRTCLGNRKANGKLWTRANINVNHCIFDQMISIKMSAIIKICKSINIFFIIFLFKMKIWLTSLQGWTSWVHKREIISPKSLV